jgi:hypothetical protein
MASDVFYGCGQSLSLEEGGELAQAVGVAGDRLGREIAGLKMDFPGINLTLEGFLSW